MNKGNITVSEASPPSVVKAFRAQFQQDLRLFLKCRSNEVVTNGHMILAVLGTSSMEPRLHWSTKVLSQAITNLVSKGLITKEKAHSFAMPLHFPSKEEVQKIVIEEGSFTIEKIETIVEDAASEVKDVEVRAEAISKAIRAGNEVLVSHHFGDQVWFDLYPELKQAILLHLKNEPVEMFNIIFMLKKIV
ncbi:caffeine synthase 1-like [Chenopodium quinoa]|nr:caffeine synthase 1-like [Chenopodium quinoa]XP_021732429.1 caffeine synthase 1-like [Chenopodium quinoa]